MSAATSQPESDAKRDAICAAAIVVFSARGFSRTSMSHIAGEAEMSRPALYQYFANKGDIFASAFMALVDGAADASLACLGSGQVSSQPTGSIAAQLDGFLQRFEGDLWERTSASPYGDDLLSAKSEYAPEAMGLVMKRLMRGLEAYLKRVSSGGRSVAAAKQRAGWMDMLEFSPKGFKFDQPSTVIYRGRLTALAASVAADIAAS